MRKILHITPHLGGGIGTVVLSWMEKDRNNNHILISLDHINEKAQKILDEKHLRYNPRSGYTLDDEMFYADIIIVHWWDHPMLADFFSRQRHPSRLVFWTHKNYPVPQEELDYPDLFLDVSPVQGHGRHIWSCGNMERFLAIQPKKHKGFNVATVTSKKLHPDFVAISKRVNIPDIMFHVFGGAYRGLDATEPPMFFAGQVDDIAPYIDQITMDVFGYPLHANHYGTAEQVLGEAMAAGVVPVVMDNPAECLIVKDGVNGFVAKNQEEYVGLIEFLYKYPDIRQALAMNAREDARKMYSIDDMVRQWEEVFDELMKQPKKERGTL